MKISDCCGAEATDPVMEDYGICPDCKEHCEWVEDDDDSIILSFVTKEL